MVALEGLPSLLAPARAKIIAAGSVNKDSTLLKLVEYLISKYRDKSPIAREAEK